MHEHINLMDMYIPGPSIRQALVGRIPHDMCIYVCIYTYVISMHYIYIYICVYTHVAVLQGQAV